MSILEDTVPGRSTVVGVKKEQERVEAKTKDSEESRRRVRVRGLSIWKV